MGKDSRGTMGFGQDSLEKGKWSQYKGKYVRISTPNLGNACGLLRELKEDDTVAVLNPYLFTDYDEDRGAVKRIIDENLTIELVFPSRMEPFPRKSLEAYAKLCNLEEESRFADLRARAEMARSGQESEKPADSKKENQN
jgi:hypothetical protein